MVSGERLQSYVGKLEKALLRLKDAIDKEPDEYIRDSSIQRFEFSFELLWKLIKRMGEKEYMTMTFSQ